VAVVGKLNISGNNFDKLPMALFDFTNLVKLNLNHNKIRYISDSIYQLIELKTLYVCDNKIHLIGDGLFGLTNLERLDLSLNCITHIPHNIHNLIKLKYLNFNSNYITYINDNLYNLTNLEELDLGHNKFDSITNDIIKLQNLNEINLSFNENLEYISPNIINVRNAININIYNTPSLDLDYRIENYLRGNNINIYNDNENVHTTSMRKNVDKSIINLLKDEYMISKEQLQLEINDTRLFIEDDLGVLNYDINNINEYMYINEEITINYYTLLTKIWGRITNSEEEIKLELLKRFKEEITDGLQLCFVGKISRAVNILCGFFFGA
jgi:Leucine-rich repeat (LRR) protein